LVLATLASLGVCTLVALLVLDPQYRIQIGVVAGAAALILLFQWLKLFAQAVDEKDTWLDAARRHDDQVEEEISEVYYVEVGEMQTPTGATRPKRFHLGGSRRRAELLAKVVPGVWERHGNEWTPQALDEIAAAFRADDNQLAHLAEERGTPTTEAQIQILRS
jgi:hypothetical protein